VKNRRRDPPKPSKEPAAASGHQRQLSFHDQFYDDFAYWMATDPRTALRLWRLMRKIMRDPFDGIGKPEPMRGAGGVWSRRMSIG
jgi:toxin YoeB